MEDIVTQKARAYRKERYQSHGMEPQFVSADIEAAYAAGFRSCQNLYGVKAASAPSPVAAAPDMETAAMLYADLIDEQDQAKAFLAGATWERQNRRDNSALTDIPTQRLRDLDMQFKQVLADPCAHSDYLRGYHNGIILAHATIFDHPADFIQPGPAPTYRTHHEPGEFGEGATMYDERDVMARTANAVDESGESAGFDVKQDPEPVTGREIFMAEASRMIANAFDQGFDFAVRFSDLYKGKTRE